MIIEIGKKINKFIEIIIIFAGVILWLISDLLGLEW